MKITTRKILDIFIFVQDPPWDPWALWIPIRSPRFRLILDQVWGILQFLLVHFVDLTELFTLCLTYPLQWSFSRSLMPSLSQLCGPSILRRSSGRSFCPQGRLSFSIFFYVLVLVKGPSRISTRCPIGRAHEDA